MERTADKILGRQVSASASWKRPLSACCPRKASGPHPEDPPAHLSTAPTTGTRPRTLETIDVRRPERQERAEPLSHDVRNSRHGGPGNAPLVRTPDVVARRTARSTLKAAPARPASARTPSRASGSSPGKGTITINGRDQEVYFRRARCCAGGSRPAAAGPCDRLGQFDVIVSVEELRPFRPGREIVVPIFPLRSVLPL